MDAKTKNEIVQAAQKIIFGQEGNYSSVNANDNGAGTIHFLRLLWMPSAESQKKTESKGEMSV